MATERKFTRPIKIGDIFMSHFDGDGNEQLGYRPCLVIQNNTGNRYSPNVIVLPLTSSLKKQQQPTHVVIYARDSGLKTDSMVLCENPKCISKDKLERYITTLSDHYMEMIAEAYILATSVISFISIEMISSVWAKASALNYC